MDRSQSTTEARAGIDHPYASQLAEAGFLLHPLVALFPPMQDDEFLALCESIRLHGQREPVLLWNGRILDGAHRTRACLRLGIKPKTEKFKGTADDAQAMVLDLNLHRRHLSTSQRAIIAAGLAQRQLGDNQHANGESAKSPTQAEAAALLNIGERTLRDAKKVLAEADDDLVEDVRAGTTSINAALKEHESREWQKEWQKKDEERQRNWAKTAEKREENHRKLQAAREKEEREWAENRPRCPEGWSEQEPRWVGDLRWTRDYVINGEPAELRIRSSSTRWAYWEISTDRYHTTSEPYDRIGTVLEALAELQAHLPGL